MAFAAALRPQVRAAPPKPHRFRRSVRAQAAASSSMGRKRDAEAAADDTRPAVRRRDDAEATKGARVGTTALGAPATRLATARRSACADRRATPLAVPQVPTPTSRPRMRPRHQQLRPQLHPPPPCPRRPRRRPTNHVWSSSPRPPARRARWTRLRTLRWPHAQRALVVAPPRPRPQPRPRPLHQRAAPATGLQPRPQVGTCAASCPPARTTPVATCARSCNRTTRVLPARRPLLRRRQPAWGEHRASPRGVGVPPAAGREAQKVGGAVAAVAQQRRRPPTCAPSLRRRVDRAPLCALGRPPLEDARETRTSGLRR